MLCYNLDCCFGEKLTKVVETRIADCRNDTRPENDTRPANDKIAENVAMPANDARQHCHHLRTAVAAETDLYDEKHSSKRFHLQCDNFDSGSKRLDKDEKRGTTHGMQWSWKTHLDSKIHFLHQGVDCTAAISVGSSEIASVEHNREQDHSRYVVAGKATAPIEQGWSVESKCSEQQCSADWKLCTLNRSN